MNATLVILTPDGPFIGRNRTDRDAIEMSFGVIAAFPTLPTSVLGSNGEYILTYRPTAASIVALSAAEPVCGSGGIS
jgi:hypothetical protein